MDFTLIGVFGGFLGVSLYLPQIIKSQKTRQTKDISWWTYILILVNDILWSIYGLGINNYVIYIPNLVSILLCGVILSQKRKYDRK